jgi:hypothetical protein
MADEKSSAIRVTKEVTVNLHGEIFDVLVIPRKQFVELDYTDCPEDNPARKVEKMQKMMSVDLKLGVHLKETNGKMGYKLTDRGVMVLLDSLLT